MIKAFFLLIALSQPLDSSEFISPAQIIKEAAKLEADSNYEKAIGLYLTISANDTSYIQIQSNLMSAYNSLEQYDKCISIGEKLKEEPSDFRCSIYITLGNAYLNKGDMAKGEAIYREGLKLFPYNYILLYNLGYVLQKQEQYEEAINYFQKSARINPFYGNNHMMLGYISMLQGHITKSFLSYLTYLAINPNSNSILVFLNNLADDGIRKEGSITPFLENQFFAYYDDLIRSKAALDSRFQQKVDFNADVVKQTELLLSKLEYKKNSNDFWMDFYVPLYTTLEDKQLSPAFIYYLLKSTKKEEILKWIDKHDKEKDEWIDYVNKILKQNRDRNYVDISGQKEKISHWFFDNNKLNAIGNQIDNEKKMGHGYFIVEIASLMHKEVIMT